MHLGIRIYSRTARTARGYCSRAYNLFAVNQIIFLSIWMSKSGRSPCDRVDQTGSRKMACHSQPEGRRMVGLIGLEPMTPALSRRCSNQLSYRPLAGLRPAISNLKFQISNCAVGAGGAWRHGDSNPRHPACKAGALPTELYPLWPRAHFPAGAVARGQKIELRAAFRSRIARTM